MSKICDKCGTTNYDSATICTRCGSLFKDGAYSLNNPRLNHVPNQPPNKSAVSERMQTEKTTKVLVIVVVSIIILIATLIIIVVASNAGKNKQVDDEVSQSAEITQSVSSNESTTKKVNGALAVQGEGGEGGVDIPDFSIELDPQSLSLKTGEQATIKATIKPETSNYKTVEWYQDGNAIEIVKQTGTSCTVQAVAEGNATIKAVVYTSYFEYTAETTIDVTAPTTTTEPESDPVYPDSEEYCGEFETDEKINLRTGPGKEYESLLMIPAGTNLTANAEKPDNNNDIWYYVEYNNKVGWVLGSYLTEVYDDEDEYE